MSNLINGSRFFKHVLPFIGDKHMIIDELIENGVRAGANNVEIRMDKGVIECFNDGNILDDFTSLLTVATTNYDKDVIDAQHPAGMGIMMMLSVSKSMVFSSGNKSLEVDSTRFFNDEKYRDELVDILNNQNSLIGDGFVDGFSTTLYCDDAFIKTLEYRHLRFDYSNKDAIGVVYNTERKYQFYDVNISINGFGIERQSHHWLVHQKGAGVFDGCEIGIKGFIGQGGKISFGGQGMVYWFGKEIACDAIAPFTIVVNDKTQCLCPTLPDRRSISTNVGQLASLKQDLENLFASDIQSKIINSLDGNSNCDFKLLKSLSTPFDVEHFTHWDVKKIDCIDIAYEKGAPTFFNGSEHDMGNYSDNVMELKRQYGGTVAPSSLLAKFADRLDVNVEYLGGSCEWIGNQECELVKSITVNGVSVQWVMDEENWQVLFDVNCGGEFIGFLLDWGDGSESAPTYDEIERDFDGVMRYYHKEIEVSSFKHSLLSLLPLTNYSDLEKMTISFNKDFLEVNVKGEKYEVKVA